MNPKALRATSSSARFCHVVQASRLRSFPNPAGGTPALHSAAPLLSSKRRCAAFTLLEVLVASAIMGIVMFVLVSTANTSLQLWRGTSEKMAVDREGRSGLTLMSWDLQNIVQPADISLRPWINTNILTTNTAPTPVLRFLTLKPLDYQTNAATDLGDVCYVEYRLTNNSIMRAFVGSSMTFSNLVSGNFPSPPESEFQLLVPNVWACKFWGLTATDTNISYGNTGEQSSTNQTLRSIEYRLGILDKKFMDLYTGPGGDNLARAQQNKNTRWYQATQPVSPPIQ
jgi:prepilin-type N-terminal cleavage/methylation domain-containing protein